MKKPLALLILAALVCLLFALPACSGAAKGIDYLVLVNKLNPLPEGWEEALETVTIVNSVGDEVEVEKKAFNAYELLRQDLETNDGIYLELDSARRSVAAQQAIMDDFTQRYGAAYAAKTVARPGYSEHHTGLALDLFFKLKGPDGTFTDVYENEDLVRYPEIWATIHAKLAKYGFILRYLEGAEHLTGYGYEPWHIRYVDDPALAQKIMASGITLEEYLGAVKSVPVTVDLGRSAVYSPKELAEAVVKIKCTFASWEGCELRAIRYAGDGAGGDAGALFLMDFHTPAKLTGEWGYDMDCTDYRIWLVLTEEDGWDIVARGI
ncbi:MAG: M15 family metallopeptidase [Eggerthellaceae bacterium]|nr:M15 family metallopeptidase [Eggerthellaceae bacterium]